MTEMHPLRQWRKDHGKTLADLKAETATSVAMLSYIECRRKRPSLQLAVKLSKATNGVVPVESFAEMVGAE
jgi:transcriptional regulator with XRE-family HTH domain